MKRLLSVLLVVMLVFSLMMPVAVADEAQIPDTEGGGTVEPGEGGAVEPEPSAEPEIPAIEVTASNNPTSGKVVLTWAAVEGAAKYEVYRSGTKDGEYKLYYTTTKLSYTNTSAYAGYWYHYKVKALDANGAEIVTSDIITQCADCAAPVITAGNRASDGKVTLKWKEVYGAEKYAIYRATARNGEYVRQYTTTSTSYTNTTSKANVTYYYKVMALASRTASANSAFSDIAARTCDVAAPVVKASNNAETGKVVLKWKPVEGAAKYEVYRSGTKNGTYKLYCTLTGTTYTNSTANAGYTYYYKVKAISKVLPEGNSAFSTVVSRTCDCAKPSLELAGYEDGVPIYKFKYTSNGNLIFQWGKVSGAGSYKVYRSGYQNGTYKLIGETKSTTFTDKTATPGYYYYYKIVAISSRTSYADSAPFTVVAAPLFPAVKNLSNVSVSKGVSLKWDPIKGVDGYAIYYASTTELNDIKYIGAVEEPKFSSTKLPKGKVYVVIGFKERSDGSIVFSVPTYITAK